MKANAFSFKAGSNFGDSEISKIVPQPRHTPRVPSKDALQLRSRLHRGHGTSSPDFTSSTATNGMSSSDSKGIVSCWLHEGHTHDFP